MPACSWGPGVPQKPVFRPSAPLSYASILKGDFEAYFADIQRYFRCLDEERARAFEEAREVSQDYGRFLEASEEWVFESALAKCVRKQPAGAVPQRLDDPSIQTSL